MLNLSQLHKTRGNRFKVLLAKKKFCAANLVILAETKTQTRENFSPFRECTFFPPLIAPIYWVILMDQRKTNSPQLSDLHARTRPPLCAPRRRPHRPPHHRTAPPRIASLATTAPPWPSYSPPRRPTTTVRSFASCRPLRCVVPRQAGHPASCSLSHRSARGRVFLPRSVHPSSTYMNFSGPCTSR
jgi:hypothetical protein